MRWNLQNWVEEIKGKPEHVRERYVIGCVFASMFFVVIVWSLTVTENFKKTIAKTSETAASGRILPKPSDFSLDEILSGAQSNMDQSKSGEEFLRERVENRTRIDPNEEGIAPKSEKAPDETSPMR